MKSIFISSPSVKTGKTTIGCFMAMNLANKGKKVLFLDSTENLNGYLFFVACESVPIFDNVKTLYEERDLGLCDKLTKFQKDDFLDVEFTNKIKTSILSNLHYDYVIVDTDYSSGSPFRLIKYSPSQIIVITDGSKLTNELTIEHSDYLSNNHITNLIISNNCNDKMSFEPIDHSAIIPFNYDFDQYYDEISFSTLKKFDFLSNSIISN
ncbi:hypothetical protein [Companilactobacillus zhachilii]|uniref:hypothetical protein n=1 Tax=Companilactobacillus zhachilii TaxID=2304606 RepID=UPI004034223D